MFVREFESRRGEILNFFAKKKEKKRIKCLRARSVGKHNSTRVDEGRRRRNLLVIKIQGTNRSGERGGRACYVTPDLSYDKEGERRAKTINGMGENKQLKKTNIAGNQTGYDARGTRYLQ